MERYEAYKDSGIEWIGVIPEGWEVVPLKQRYSFITGFTPDTKRPEYYDLEGFDWVTIADMSSDVVTNTASKISQLAVDEINPTIIPSGSLMYSFKLSTGKTAFAGREVYTNEAIASFAPNNPCIRFLRYSSYLIEYAANKNIYGAKLLNASLLRNALLVYPPIEEQRAIADYLDAETAEIDALVTDCEREVGLLREYRKAVISEAVTRGLDPDVPMRDSGVEWIGRISESWSIVPLKHLVASIESGTSLDGASWPASDCEKGVLTLSAVYQSVFDSTQNKAVQPALYGRLSCPLKPGALLISRCNTSEWVGTAAYVDRAPDNLYLPDKLWQLTFDSDCRCRYIQYSLQGNMARNYFAALSVGASSSMQNIAKPDLLATPIAMPDSDLISKIVVYLDSKTSEIDSLIDAKQSMADRLREYRRSLISEAVTGKFRVSGVDE